MRDVHVVEVGWMIFREAREMDSGGSKRGGGRAHHFVCVLCGFKLDDKM